MKRVEILAVLLAAVLGTAALYLIVQWRDAGAVQTSGLLGCPPPSEFEHLHIVVGQREGQLVQLGCMFVGPKGAYKPRRI